MYPSTKCLSELVLPPNNSEPQSGLAPASICLPSELLCCLVQDIVQDWCFSLASVACAEAGHAASTNVHIPEPVWFVFGPDV